MGNTNSKTELVNGIVSSRSWEADLRDLTDLARYVAGSGEELAELVGANSRDIIYGWSALRSRPTTAQRRKLTVLASLVTLLSEECGVTPQTSREHLHSYEYRQDGVEIKSRLQRLADGEIRPVFQETVQYFIEQQIA